MRKDVISAARFFDLAKFSSHENATGKQEKEHVLLPCMSMSVYLVYYSKFAKDHTMFVMEQS